MLKLDQLRCFAAASSHGSFVEAGKELNLSASAVAYNIESLESRLQTILLIRKPSSGVLTTNDGNRLLKMVEPLLVEVKEIEQTFTISTKHLEGELVVGCQEGLSWSLVPCAIEQTTIKHPKLRVSEKTVFMDEGNTPVQSGDVDLLITFAALPIVPDIGITNEILCEPYFYALMRAGHPLTHNGENVSLKKVAEYPHIFIFDGPAWPLFTGMYNDLGLSPKFDSISNASAGTHAIVGRSDNVSLRVVKPAHDLSPLGDKLAFLPITDSTRQAAIVAVSVEHRRGRRNPKVDAFVAECRKLFANGTMRNHLFY